MKKILLVLLTTFISFSAKASEYIQIDEKGNKQEKISIDDYFKEIDISNYSIEFNPDYLLFVAKNTLDYFDNYESSDNNLKISNALSNIGITNKNIKETLDYIQKVLEEDKNKKQRMKDINFLKSNFRFIKWNPYNPKNKEQEKIRITKYAIFEHQGSIKPNKKYNIPLYGIKKDIADNDLFYKKYTKQDIISGKLADNKEDFEKVEILGYLTREGLEEALMQGTILINFEEGFSKYFNVYKNNGISYIKGLNPKEQKRFWFFRETNSINGYGNTFENRIKVKHGVTFAGDIYNIGLGKVVIMIYGKENSKFAKIGIIADTGGAFVPNLFQLDFLAGTFKNRKEFYKKTLSLPSYADILFLVKK